MQTNRFKIYSYPYFAEFTSDYKKAEFHIEGRAEYDSSNESIVFGINYSINNDYINKLISNDEIRVAVRIACKPLGFQKTINIPSNAQSIKYVINSLDVDGDVDIDAFLVTNKDIKLSDSSFSKDWEDEEPFVERGNVIGESNTYVISTDHYRDGGKQSIVSFTEVRAMNDKEYFDVDLSGDRIVFRLSSRMYKHYNKVSKKNEESVIVDFLIPEFTSILQQMKEDDNGDNTFNAYYKNKEWYKVISNKYEKELHRDPCTSDINPLVAAQMLLKVGTKKLNAAFKEMDYIVKTREGGLKMTNLRVFTDKGLDFIHQNMSDFFEALKNSRDNTSWIKDFCKKDPTTSSPYSFDFEFETNSLNPNEGEFHNAVNLYELFKTNKIGNAIIYNEKFAAGFLLTFGYEYFFWASDLVAETRVSATFFFDHRKGLRQALARNLLTRLYKVVEMTIDESAEDKYELTRFIFNNPPLRRIVYYPNMDGEKTSRSFIKAIKIWKENNPNAQITMKFFEKARLQYSAFAHVNMLECMNEDVLVNFLLSYLNKEVK